MDKKRKRVIAQNEVSDLYTFELGGYGQKVLIEGKSRELPVVISLHGGPGTPIPFSAGCRGLFPEFTDKFIMVYWDQLGCGINNHVIDERFHIDSFVDMTIDLVREVRRLFPHNKIFFFAVSWGSILCVKALEKERDLVDGAVVYGQIVRELFLSEEVIDALTGSQIPPQKLERIKAMDPDHITPEEMQLVSSSVRKYTDGYQNKKGKRTPIFPVMWGLLTSPDYKFRDFKAVMMNGYMNQISLWKEILKLDLSHAIENIQISYTIIQGDTDIVASTSIVQSLTENTGHAWLQCKIVKDTGHMPGPEGMELVYSELIRLAYA